MQCRTQVGQRAPATASLGADSLRILLGCPGGPSGGAEEEQARSARVLSGPSEGQALPDGLTLSLTEVLQVSPPHKETCPPPQPGVSKPSLAEEQVSSGPHCGTDTPGPAASPTAPQHLASFISLSPGHTSVCYSPTQPIHLHWEMQRPNSLCWSV